MATRPQLPHGAQAIQQAASFVVLLAVGLTSFGLVMVYSTSSAQRAALGEDMAYGLVRQAIWVVLGVGLAWLVARTPLTTLRRLAGPLLVVVLLLLAITLGFAPSVKGARRWLRLGALSMQPSEFAKIAVLLFLADRLARREPDSSFGMRLPLLPVLLPVGLTLVLVFLAPDLGMTLFLVAECVVLLGLAGVRPGRVLPYVLVSLPAILLYAFTHFGHVKKRLAAFTGEPSGQVREALVAIGAGGFLGVGLGRGMQKLHYVAEAHTDFIFSIIGEELGFMGCAAVVCAFMGLVVHGRRIAWSARAWSPQDPFPFYVAAGATFLITFQALVNLAVVTGSAPTKGVSMPFISVGGSNLLVMATCVGLLVNVARASAALALDAPRR
ncbi:MAG: cell division protein FtsW [Planctomycetes bacterium]|nr:cell division protein FtsW [Planctomycetota bacterium]MCB9829795.1 cell division protein FtsW [Planctomycetota bacterium]MCB9902608.1 cell division protein FtsW [Planctomycetota bacterium]